MSNDVSKIKILSELVKIQNGHPFSKRIENSKSGNIAVIQMKDLPDGMIFSEATPDRIEADHIKPHYLLEPNDIIFRSRGQTNTAVILKADFGSVVAAAPLITLRAASNELDSDYLCWWINQSTAQVHLARHAKGTSVQMINRDALETLEVPLPPIEIQRKIAELALMREHEQVLLTRLAAAKENKINGILMKTVMEVAHGNESL